MLVIGLVLWVLSEVYFVGFTQLWVCLVCLWLRIKRFGL